MAWLVGMACPYTGGMISLMLEDDANAADDDADVDACCCIPVKLPVLDEPAAPAIPLLIGGDSEEVKSIKSLSCAWAALALVNNDNMLWPLVFELTFEYELA